MKAVMAPIPPGILAWRKRTGSDRYDEMWEGVLHMVAAPNREHQDLEWALEAFLRSTWGRSTGGKVYHQINVARPGGWPEDYRIPDLVMLTPERFSIDRNEYFDGPPEVVIEIRSPGDETYDKLEFYALIGVPEVWVVDRDTKGPEMFRLADGEYHPVEAGAHGWLTSSATSVELRPAENERLSARFAGKPSSGQELPE